MPPLALIFSALVAFLKDLPALIDLWKSIKKAFGDNSAKFLSDLTEVTKAVEASKDSSLSMDEKRKIRIEALQKGRGLWDRIGN